MPNRPQGQPVTISTTVSATDPVTGLTTLTDPGSILLRVRKPDLTFLPDFTSPAHPSLGKYYVNLSATTDLVSLGQYRWAWITTGTAAGVTPRAGIINLIDAFAPAHISVEDAKLRLNVSATDDEIQDMIDAAVVEQENRVGAVAPRAVTETLTASGGLLRPTIRPVLSVTSATLAGVAQVVSGWQVNSGSITPAVGSAGFSGTYVVTYTAGRNPVPQDLVEAALLRVEAAYDTQRGPAGVPLAVEQDSGFGSSYPLLLRAKDKEALYFTPGSA